MKRQPIQRNESAAAEVGVILGQSLDFDHPSILPRSAAPRRQTLGEWQGHNAYNADNLHSPPSALNFRQKNEGTEKPEENSVLNSHVLNASVAVLILGGAFDNLDCAAQDRACRPAVEGPVGMICRSVRRYNLVTHCRCEPC
jgi:hypothetical protein